MTQTCTKTDFQNADMHQVILTRNVHILTKYIACEKKKKKQIYSANNFEMMHKILKIITQNKIFIHMDRPVFLNSI